MKLLITYIPYSSEFSQKLSFKQINKIINKFFDEKIEKPEDGNEKEINYNTYSKYILEYNENSNNSISSELLNEYNNNAPFFYFISILSYIFRNCPFDKKNVDCFVYSQKKLKLKILKNDNRSSSVKKISMSTARKYNNEYIDVSNIVQKKLSSKLRRYQKLDRKIYLK